MARHIRNKVFIKKMAYSGATASHLLYYAEVILDEKPNSIIIHGGTNDLYGRYKNNKPAEEIAHDLINIGAKAKSRGVKKFFISSVLPIDDNSAYNGGLDVNIHLKQLCQANNFIYICNSFLTLDDLKDAVHLTENGRIKLVNNYINYLNSYWLNQDFSETNDEDLAQIIENNDIDVWTVRELNIYKIPFLLIVI